jgi:hypothetical protein
MLMRKIQPAVARRCGGRRSRGSTTGSAKRGRCQHAAATGRAARRCFADVAAAARRRPNPHLHRADMIVTALCGDVRIAVVRCSQLALDAQRRWGWTDPSSAEMWGAHAAYTNMYSAFMQPGERVKAMLQQPDRNLFAEAISMGEVRGFASTESGADVGGDSGAAPALLLDRIRYGWQHPHHTSVPSCGDIRRTWQRVYDDSEQISTFTCASNAQTDKQPHCASPLGCCL